MEDRYRKQDQHRILRERSSVFGFFITRIRLIILLVIAIFTGGTIALATIPREADPEVKIPIAVVTTAYPGAGPADVEVLVTDPLEDEIEDLDGLRRVLSSSYRGFSRIIVEFEADEDLKSSIADLKSAVADAPLPDGAEDPDVTEIRANDFPIAAFSVSGTVSAEELEDIAERVQEELEGIAGVSDVVLIGAREKEFSVVVNPEKAARAGVSLPSVIGSLRSSNANMPFGDQVLDGTVYVFRSEGRFRTADDIKRMAVASRGGDPVFLSDIADVSERFREPDVYSRVSFSRANPEPALVLQIFKKTGGNIIRIVDEAEERVQELAEDGVIPSCCRVEKVSDYSTFIREDLNNLGTSGIFTVILIFLVLLSALGIREAVVAFVSVPLSFFISFFVLQQIGFTLNSLTLFSLVLSLGLLVDTFIVILEGVFHNVRRGYRAQDAALLAVAHYKKPLFASIFTTISAFVPMLLVSGILGEYLKVLPITLSLALLSSLFVSLTIVPALTSLLLRRMSADARESLLERLVTKPLGKRYISFLRSFLADRRAKVKATVVLSLCFLFSLGVLVSGFVPVELFPKVDANFTFIDITLTPGSSKEKTERVVAEIEERIRSLNDVKNMVSTIGMSSSFGVNEQSTQGDHLASITVNFVEKEKRERSSSEIVESIRVSLAGINDAVVRVREITAGPPTGAPIEARIQGEDLEELSRTARMVERIIASTEGTRDVESSEEFTPPDMVFSFRQDRLARIGIPSGDAALYGRAALYRVGAGELVEGNDSYDITVSFPEEYSRSLEGVRSIPIVSRTGARAPLGSLADISMESSRSVIKHRDFKRTIVVRAQLEDGYQASAVVPQIEEAVKEAGIPAGYSVSFGGEVEDIERSFSELWSAMIVAVILIALILVLEFNSFLQPLAILMTLPLMLIGVVVGILVLGIPFSFSTFLGIVSLAGIVVNDAIVLIDKANRNRRELGMPPREAIADAGLSRLQPILLTTITTVFGVIPLMLANEFWFGLSSAVAFGIVFATALTLIVIPMLYLAFEKSGK